MRTTDFFILFSFFSNAVLSFLIGSCRNNTDVYVPKYLFPSAWMQNHVWSWYSLVAQYLLWKRLHFFRRSESSGMHTPGISCGGGLAFLAHRASLGVRDSSTSFIIRLDLRYPGLLLEFCGTQYSEILPIEFFLPRRISTTGSRYWRLHRVLKTMNQRVPSREKRIWILNSTSRESTTCTHDHMRSMRVHSNYWSVYIVLPTASPTRHTTENLNRCNKQGTACTQRFKVGPRRTES